MRRYNIGRISRMIYQRLLMSSASEKSLVRVPSSYQTILPRGDRASRIDLRGVNVNGGKEMKIPRMMKRNLNGSLHGLLVVFLVTTSLVVPNIPATPIPVANWNACQRTALAALSSCKAAAQSNLRSCFRKMCQHYGPQGAADLSEGG